MTTFWTRGLVYYFRYVPIVVIGVYKTLISPFLPPSCRFYPTCSTYARLAFKKYGLLRGGMLSLMRIGRCHPFHSGGYDPLE